MKNWTLKKYIALAVLILIAETLIAIPVHIDLQMPIGLSLLFALGFWILIGLILGGLYWSLKTILYP